MSVGFPVLSCSTVAMFKPMWNWWQMLLDAHCLSAYDYLDRQRCHLVRQLTVPPSVPAYFRQTGNITRSRTLNSESKITNYLCGVRHVRLDPSDDIVSRLRIPLKVMISNYNTSNAKVFQPTKYIKQTLSLTIRFSSYLMNPHCFLFTFLSTIEYWTKR